jgi:hypothetical protein
MSPTDIKTWVEIIQAVLTSLGIVLAGWWSIFTFGLGRSFAPNVILEVSFKNLIDLKMTKAVILSVKAKNIGKTRVLKESCRLTCIPVYGGSSENNDKREFNRIDPDEVQVLEILPRQYEILNAHDSLEPEEEAKEDVVLQINSASVLKAGVTFYGHKYLWGRKQQWTTYVVIELQKAGSLSIPKGVPYE